MIELGDRQTKAVGVAVTVLAVLVILAAMGGVVWLLAIFVRSYQNVLLPLAVAGVAALVCQPYYELLRERLRLPMPLALLALFLSVLLPIVAFSWFFGSIVADQLSELVSRVPEWWRQALAFVEERWPAMVTYLEENPMGQRIRGAVEGQGDEILQGLQVFGLKALSAGAGLLRGIGATLSWAVAPIYFVFFLVGGKGLTLDAQKVLPFLKPETREDVVFLVGEFLEIVVAFFRGQLTIAFLQGMLFALGFSLAGLRYGLVLGLMLGFLNIVPYLGNIVGLGIALPLAMFQDGGGWGTLVAVMVVFVAVQMIEGYFLTPKIMGDRTGLHPMAIIVAVFFWGSALGGILGMILAIPLTAFLVVFWRLAQEKYIEEWV